MRDKSLEIKDRRAMLCGFCVHQKVISVESGLCMRFSPSFCEVLTKDFSGNTYYFAMHIDPPFSHTCG
jgi:hypothetical protein